MKSSTTPRSRGGRPAVPPRVLSHAAPLPLGRPIEPQVYSYAHDAVIEVVPAGLWIRPAEVPPGADQVRAVAADLEHATVIYDDGIQHGTARMRALAEGVVARLAGLAGDRGTLLPASAAAAKAGPAPAPTWAAAAEAVPVARSTVTRPPREPKIWSPSEE